MVYRRSKGSIRKPRRYARRAAPRSSARPTRRRYTTRRGTARRSKPCVCPSELTPTAKFALAQLDPFEPKCLGAKIPDSNTMPSIANQDTDQVVLPSSSTAGQLVAYAFAPSYTCAVNSAVSTGVGSVTWNTTWAPRRNLTPVVNAVEAIRPVAHGLRLSSGLAPTAATGFVHIGLCVESRVSNVSSVGQPDYPLTVNDMTGLAHYARFTLASLTQSPVTVINKWIDELAFRYDDPRSAYSYSGTGTIPFPSVLNMQQSWGVIIIMIDGQPANIAPVTVEHILLTEALPRKDGFILGTTAAPNSPGTISATSTMLADTSIVHTEAQQESYVAQGLQAFSRGAQVAGEQVLTNVAIPLLERVGYGIGMTAAQMSYNAVVGRGGLPGVNSNPSRLTL